MKDGAYKILANIWLCLKTVVFQDMKDGGYKILANMDDGGYKTLANIWLCLKTCVSGHGRWWLQDTS